MQGCFFLQNGHCGKRDPRLSTAPKGKGHSWGTFQKHLIVSHQLVTAKQNAYGFEFDSLKEVNNYLSHRKQRTKLNHSYCSWEEVPFGVLEGSILGPILFNIFLSDIFLIIKDTDFESYADDNTISKTSNNIDDAIAYYKSHSKSSSKSFQIITWREAPINPISS